MRKVIPEDIMAAVSMDVVRILQGQAELYLRLNMPMCNLIRVQAQMKQSISRYWNPAIDNGYGFVPWRAFNPREPVNVWSKF